MVKTDVASLDNEVPLFMPLIALIKTTIIIRNAIKVNIKAKSSVTVSYTHLTLPTTPYV